MTKIALVTATHLKRPDQEIEALREALIRRGAEATVVPWDASGVVWSDFDRALVRSPWDYHQRLIEFLDWSALVASQTRLDNSREVILWNCHKSYLADLAERGVATIPTRFLNSPVEAGLHDWADREVVLKPAVSAGAVGAWRGPGDSPELSKHLELWLERGEVLAQPLVTSVLTRGEISLLFFAGEFSHAVLKRPQAGDYRVQDVHGGSAAPYAASPAEIEVGRRALAAAPDPPLYARVDLVYWEDAPVVIELELIEPELFLRFCEPARERLAELLLQPDPEF